MKMARYFRTAARWFCLVVVVDGVSLEAQTANVPICKLLDDLTSFRNQSVAVSGELVGSFYHGFYLAPEGQAETCPGWPERGFTRHALIALTFPWDRAGNGLVIPPEFLRLDHMIRREHLYPKVVVTVRGRVDAKWLVVSYRSGTGKWLGLIGGDPFPDGSVPARLEVERVSNWTSTLDDGQRSK